MPAGDGLKVWFPEVIAELRQQWQPELTLQKIIDLAEVLNTILGEIQIKKEISPPRYFCSNCSARHRSEPARISVAGLISALVRFDLEEEGFVKKLKSRWSYYRKKNDLDRFGRVTQNSGKTGAISAELRIQRFTEKIVLEYEKQQLKN